MVATDAASQDATLATAGVRLNFAVIDRRLQDLGHEATREALAAVTGLDRGTIWRYRNEKLRPLLVTAVRIADSLGLPLQELVERVPAPGGPA